MVKRYEEMVTVFHDAYLTEHRMNAGVIAVVDKMTTDHAAEVREVLEAQENLLAVWRMICNTNGWDSNHYIQARTLQKVIDKYRHYLEVE